MKQDIVELYVLCGLMLKNCFGLYYNCETECCNLYVISGFQHEGDKKCTLLSFYAASCGNFLPMFRDNLSVPSSRSRNAEFAKWPHIDGLLKS